jgi:hypothetical protein
MPEYMRSGVEQVEQGGTGGGTGAPVPPIRIQNKGIPRRGWGGTGQTGFETILTRENVESEAPTCARICTLDCTCSTCSTCSTSSKRLESSEIQVEQVDQALPVPPVPSSEFAEVEALEVRFLGALPVPFTLTLTQEGASEPFYVSTDAGHVQELRRLSRPVWAPVGFEYAAWAIQQDRATASDFARWCGRLRTGWRLGLDEACAGVPGLIDMWRDAKTATGVRTEPSITLGALLRRVGARVTALEFADERQGRQSVTSAQAQVEAAW